MGAPVTQKDFRVYQPSECRPDGYPWNWPELNAATVVEAGHRCLRCKHPYVKGQHGPRGEWSVCDEKCVHRGPIRYDPDSEPEEAQVITGLKVASGTPVEARWRILTVHHLRPGHENKRDCRWWNLLPLCQRCHLLIQGKVKPDRPYPWPHRDWFQLHVAGFYAAKYLQEDLSRTEVEERMEELLLMGATQDAVERMPI